MWLNRWNNGTRKCCLKHFNWDDANRNCTAKWVNWITNVQRANTSITNQIHCSCMLQLIDFDEMLFGINVQCYDWMWCNTQLNLPKPAMWISSLRSIFAVQSDGGLIWHANLWYVWLTFYFSFFSFYTLNLLCSAPLWRCVYLFLFMLVGFNPINWFIWMIRFCICFN